MTGSRDWTGRVGDVWAEEWRRTDRSFTDLSRHLDTAIAAAAPAGAFRALDIGCGAGGTSFALASARPDARIVGVDLSEALVDVARQRLAPAVLPRRREPRAANESAGRRSAQPHDEASTSPFPGEGRGPGAGRSEDTENEGDSAPAVAGEWQSRSESTPPPQEPRIRFLTGDALDLAETHAPFDLLYSRHGVMFFDDPVAAFTTLRAAATPGAHLVFSCFRDWSDNAFAAAPAAALDLPPPTPGPGPFAFADRDHVAAILTAAGWRDATATATDFTYRAGAGDDPVGDALDLLQRIGPAASALRMLSDGDRAEKVDRLRGVIERHRSDDTVDFPAAAWIWSATA